MVEVLRALVVMTCWWHQDIEQSLFSAPGLKVRQPIHWPCDLFPGPPSNYNHNESYVYVGNAWLSLRWALQRRPEYFELFLQPSLVLTLSPVCPSDRFLKFGRQGSSSNAVETHNSKHLLSKCSESLFQTPHCLKRESTRTSSKIASVLFIAASGAAGKSSRL